MAKFLSQNCPVFIIAIFHWLLFLILCRYAAGLISFFIILMSVLFNILNLMLNVDCLAQAYVSVNIPGIYELHPPHIPPPTLLIHSFKSRPVLTHILGIVFSWTIPISNLPQYRKQWTRFFVNFDQLEFSGPKLNLT